MLPWRRILCPTDLSEPSYVALRLASELAEHFGGELYLVNVVTRPDSVATTVTEPPMVTTPSGSVREHEEQMQQEAQNAMSELVETYVADGIPVHQVAELGDPADRIIAVANETSADLIVMGTHGETGWRRAVFGSVTEKVVRKATVPVLTIQSQQPI